MNFRMFVMAGLGVLMATSVVCAQEGQEPAAAEQMEQTMPEASSMEEQVVSAGKEVSFHYTLRVDGEDVESSRDGEPITYTHGQNQIIPGLEAALEGAKVGDKKTIMVTPEDGYGDRIEEAVQEIPRSNFPEDFVPEVGLLIEMESPEGDILPAVIEEVKDDALVLNFNHPLAGKTLEFDIEIVDIK